MNWLLGIVGALFGIAVAESRGLLGAVAGFFIVFLLMTQGQLKRRVAALERDLQVLRARTAGPAPAPSATAAPAVAAAPGTSEAGAVSPAPAPSSPVPMANVPSGIAEAAPAASMAAPPVEPTPVVASVPAPAPASPAPAASTARPAAPTPRAPATPGWEEKLGARLKSWFTEGNMQVKIGVVVIFFGVAAALKLAADRGYFTFPIEFRLAAIAAAALVGLALGWRERERRPAFGLSLQGGALGVLLLTVFAGFRLYGLLPPMLAFGLIVVLVAGAALLSVLQKNMWLAVLGFLGGYLAPVLISTGSANHIGLFSYYAVLNGAVFAISWKQSWRLLNLVGFFFTFGVGTAWGVKFYRPELFATVEPFLVLFFLFYIAIGLLYVIRQTEHRRPWVDGTLVFGTPLLAFPLQAGMLKHDRMALAFSALAVALVYGGLVWWLRRRRDERLLTEAYGALALGFATLAVPLAFSAGTTASVWALEGAGVAWLGIRQRRNFPWLSGLALQLLAAGAYLLSLGNGQHAAPTPPTLLLLNADWLGAAVLSFSAFALSLIHDRHRPLPGLPQMLFVWAAFWWLIGGIGQMGLAEHTLGAWRFAALYISVAIATAALLRRTLHWARLNWQIAFGAVLGLLMVFYASGEYDAPLAVPTLWGWAAYAAAVLWALWEGRSEKSRSLAATHLLWLWSVALAATLQLLDFSDRQSLADGWEYLALMAPVTLMTLGLWRRPSWLAWPRAGVFAGHALGWFAPAIVLLLLAQVTGLFLEGRAAPLPYVPLLNPLELAWLGVAAMLFAMAGDGAAMLRGLRRLWPLVGFAFVTQATLRAVHHGHGEPWSLDVLDSGFSQASLTVVWSLVGVGSMLLGSRRAQRPLWFGGWILMIVVLAKLALIDRHYMGNTPGIVSCLVVGLLLVAVGYFAPSPPKVVEGEPA